MVDLVEQILKLHKDIDTVPERHKEGINLTKDCATDKLIYKLYGLSEEEIKIVEGA